MLDGTLNSGNFTTSAKDGIWVIVIVHRDAITAKELAIWPETVRIATNVVGLVI